MKAPYVVVSDGKVVFETDNPGSAMSFVKGLRSGEIFVRSQYQRDGIRRRKKAKPGFRLCIVTNRRRIVAVGSDRIDASDCLDVSSKIGRGKLQMVLVPEWFIERKAARKGVRS